MDRRRFLTLSGATGVGLATSLTPQLAQASAPINNAVNAQDLGLIADSASDQTDILQKAIYQASADKLPLFIPAGTYAASDVNLPENIHILGVNALTILTQSADYPIFYANQANGFKIENIVFKGNETSGADSQIFTIQNCQNFHIESCQFHNGNGNGLNLFASNGQIIDNEFNNLGQAAIFSNDGRNLTISRNKIHDIDNNGILIWQQKNADDGSIITQNHIYAIGSKDGGSGQNGNGVNIFRANAVIVSDNRFDDCYYSAVRINSGNNCQIINNNCSNIGEVAIFAEFAFNGVVINNNLVDGAGAGISITNLNENGHLAVCKGNLLRNLTTAPLPTQPNDVRNYGIAAEGDVLVEGNVVENATTSGISGGYGEYQRNLTVANNMVKDCGYGITASVAPDAGRISISNNSINNPKNAAIVGFEWDNVATSDLINEDQKFDEGSHKNIHLSQNVLT